nr:DUF6056 family protein [uncultured Acetatifactor sp.]
MAVRDMEHVRIGESGEHMEKKNRAFCATAAIVAGILILAVMEWLGHRRIPFMMDDLWYATNLATDRPLQGLGDVMESQVWHFLNWGGRCVTHGILQLTLMCGELGADMLNMVATLVLGWMVCVTAGWRKPFCFLCASSLIVALNANVKMSMFWQAGTVNYVYSTVWILAFLWPYLRQTEEPEADDLPLVNLWIWPLGLMAGWSNENMGPASLVTALAAVVYLVKGKKRRLKAWMAGGPAACLLGSILVVAAPGNFVRAQAVEKLPLGAFLYERLFSMLRAGADYLFPAALLLAAVLLFWTVCLKERLRPAQWMLLALAVLSYGAMVLSPHYPDRATFGTMVACIALSLSVLKGILAKRRDMGIYAGGMVLCYWVYGVYVLAVVQQNS